MFNIWISRKVGGGKPGFIAFSNLHGVKTPTVAYFKPPT
jgi:hypothetical protein